MFPGSSGGDPAGVVAAVRGRWLRQTFVHWPFRPQAVQALLPPELAVDVYERAAWVGLTPFVMADVLIDVAGTVMPAARAVGAPFHLGSLRVAGAGAGDSGSYAGRRVGGRGSYRLSVRPGEPLRPTERDVWLTSRRRAYTRRPGRIRETPVEHEPWPPADVAVDGLEQTLARAAGLPVPLGEPVVHFSPGVTHVRPGASRPVSA
ncbi:DUF2071 domain-containing protein [Streptomyces griseorubiginosus]|uniref:DUF2071 domain-containing protein n=1 Tax=Streptomyces griseorubiginosus TaxID=67304 RepID=UPI003F53F61A